MLTKILNIVVLLTTMLCAGAAYAGDVEDGYAAYAKKNYAVAMAYFKKAAAQGSAAAQYNLGAMYDNGQGVVQDYAEAMKWYKSAAAQGGFKSEVQPRYDASVASSRRLRGVF